MRHYLKNGKVIARSYETSRGIMFEVGRGRDENTSPFVMNDFFATSSRVIDSKKVLREYEKKLGEVEIRDI